MYVIVLLFSDAVQPLLITHRLRGELENFNEIFKLKIGIGVEFFLLWWGHVLRELYRIQIYHENRYSLNLLTCVQPPLKIISIPSEVHSLSIPCRIRKLIHNMNINRLTRRTLTDGKQCLISILSIVFRKKKTWAETIKKWERDK